MFPKRFLFYACVLSVCMYVHYEHTGPARDQMRASESPELELQRYMSHHVGAKNEQCL